jgi:hypothetical protein
MKHTYNRRNATSCGLTIVIVAAGKVKRFRQFAEFKSVIITWLSMSSICDGDRKVYIEDLEFLVGEKLSLLAPGQCIVCCLHPVFADGIMQNVIIIRPSAFGENALLTPSHLIFQTSPVVPFAPMKILHQQLLRRPCFPGENIEI